YFRSILRMSEYHFFGRRPIDFLTANGRYRRKEGNDQRSEPVFRANVLIGLDSSAEHVLATATIGRDQMSSVGCVSMSVVVRRMWNLFYFDIGEKLSDSGKTFGQCFCTHSAMKNVIALCAPDVISRFESQEHGIFRFHSIKSQNNSI